VPSSTYYRFVDEDEAFRDAIAEAEAIFEKRLVASILHDGIALKSWRAKLELLSRRFPDRWGLGRSSTCRSRARRGPASRASATTSLTQACRASDRAGARAVMTFDVNGIEVQWERGRVDVYPGSNWMQDVGARAESRREAVIARLHQAISIALSRPAYDDGERILPDGSIRHARAALLSLPGAVLTMDADHRDEDREAADLALIAGLDAYEREFDKLGL
jgi:hypothetical protein